MSIKKKKRKPGKRKPSLNPNPKKKNATSFKKGNTASVGNASTPVPNFHKEERLIKHVDGRMITRYINLNSGLTLEEMDEKLKEENKKKITMMEYMIIRAMRTIILTGDMNKLDSLLDRAIGRVPQKTIHGIEDPYEGKTVQELEEIRSRLVETNRKIVTRIEQTEKYKQIEKKVKSEYEELDDDGSLDTTLQTESDSTN